VIPQAFNWGGELGKVPLARLGGQPAALAIDQNAMPHHAGVGGHPGHFHSDQVAEDASLGRSMDLKRI
jgi:hypothetical protein